jgi:hypothetical protein
VILDAIDGHAHHLGAALGPFIGEARHGAEFGRADGGEILGVAEQDGPVCRRSSHAARSCLIGFDGEIWDGIVYAKAHVVISYFNLSFVN